MTAPANTADNQGIVAALKDAAETIRFIDSSGMVPGSIDLTADLLEKAADDSAAILPSLMCAARMMKANGLGDVAEYGMLLNAIKALNPGYLAKIGVTL